MPRLLLVLATAGALAAGAPAYANHSGDVDCSNFRYQEDAQAHDDAHPGDRDRLDDDNDGIACETLPRRGGGGTVPTGGVDAGFGGAVNGGLPLGPALVTLGGATLAVAGARVRRRSR